MSFFDNLVLGFSVALSLQNLAYCLLGTVLGTAIGVLPGLGPVATISMLLPITFGLDPTAAMILLAGIYYGAQYGGSTTAILVNLPGETSSVVTAIDGYQMARQGRAREALVVAALGSFFAGTVGTLAIAAFAPALSRLALGFGAPEYFSLMVLGLIAAVVLAHGSVLKAVAMVVLGLVLGLVGTDVNSGVLRFTFGISDLFDGLDFVAVAMGLFGIAEVISNLERKDEMRAAVTLEGEGSFLLSRKDFRAAWPAVVRGTGLGAILGILPGGGAILGSFASYMLEKRIARDPSRFGKGAIEGVAGPESANNAGAQTSFIPMLTLGLPSNAVMAMMIGALIIHNIQPGPQVMTANPSLFWGLIASMWIGNLLLVILNLPLVGVWVRMLKIPYRLLYPAILVMCAIGVYSVSNATALVYVMALFGVLGYVLVKFQCEPAPLLLGFVLGPLMEENLRRALTISGGDATVFFTQPLSLALLLLAAGLLVVMSLPRAARLREAAFDEES
ncbi:tripartite tricarboxylate transporter permease [Xanthobacter sp. KR7-225]|uniref:tripartite tricarboxylate transporter permease n=1 Tax=Xanthobacter sp. KR7-225 TaxID=3156613 RepID=UPI0032B407E2